MMDTVDSSPETAEDEATSDVAADAPERGGAGLPLLVLFGLLVVVVVSSFLITYAVRGGFSSDPEPVSVETEEFASLPEDPNAPATAPVAISGAALPEYDLQATVDPAVGQPAPEITGVNFSNKPISIENDGRPKVIVMLSHYSTIAGTFIADTDTWLNENETPAGVDVYGVSTRANAEKSNYPPATWFRITGWPFLSTTIVDSDTNEVLGALGGPGVPYFVVIDANGNVVTRQIGNVSAVGFGQLLTAAATGVAPELVDRFTVQ